MEIKAAKAIQSLSELQNIVKDKHSTDKQDIQKPYQNFINALKTNYKDSNATKQTKIIAEIKRSSPSTGLIREDFDPKSIAAVYEKHGASAISVLTTKFGFEGDLEYLREVKKSVSIPVLRKDFITEEYQVYEACASDADAILLIASILDRQQLKDLYDLARSLGMAVLVEVHASDELDKTINCGSEIIGINNRNLKTFEVNIKTTSDLLKEIPENKIVVSESGIKTRNDIEVLEKEGVSAFLIGTTFMKSDNIGKALNVLSGNN